jgi:hypothetical protein
LEIKRGKLLEPSQPSYPDMGSQWRGVSATFAGGQFTSDNHSNIGVQVGSGSSIRPQVTLQWLYDAQLRLGESKLEFVASRAKLKALSMF